MNGRTKRLQAMNGRTKRLPVSGLCATRLRTKTAVTVITQPRPSWKVGLVTLVAEPATTRVGNSIGATIGGMEDRRGIKAGLEGQA